MNSRRSPRRAEAERAWADFVSANQTRFVAAGLPPLAMQSPAHWDDLLAHGRFALHADPDRFDISGLHESQYQILVDLAESYFAAGYEIFVPAGLKSEDQARLKGRFQPR